MGVVEYKVRKAVLGEELACQMVARKLEDSNLVGFVMLGMLTESIKRGELLVCEVMEGEEKKIVAFANYHKTRNGYTTLGEIAVLREYRNMGMASKMIQKMPRPIKCKCIRSNPACKFYLKYGFMPKGVEKGRKQPLVVFYLD